MAHFSEPEVGQTAWVQNRAVISLLATACLSATLACSPYLPPTLVPPPVVASPELDGFRAALQVYVDQTQPFRKAAAVTGNAAPNQTTSPGDANLAVRLRQKTLAESIQTKVRPGAMQGDLFPPPVADVIRRRIAAAFSGPRVDLIRDELSEQVEGQKGPPPPVAVNRVAPASRIPPVLLESLPQLPEQLAYDFSGTTLILRDVDADLVIDFVPDAFPEPSPAATGVTPSGARVAQIAEASSDMPALPDIPGATVFALIGDSGSGDQSQKNVADAMLRYFTTARRFRFVLLLGDNLYDDDYIGEFSVPYKGLLDRGVIFYAALGNHDKHLEVHYKPFNMGDRAYYAFTEGNARFVVLNSNQPRDRAQLAWLDTAFGNTGAKWRISFFHHPLYSSGDHAEQSRDAIRPALEPALVRNRVDVVFSGHDHLYERIAPQQGIRYFVSGGGGRNLYDFHKSAFDEAGSSSHHFMVVEIAGDRLFFAALTPEGRTLDCGVLWRTAEAATPGDAITDAWQNACRVATAPRLSD
jgi:hypothetical protein